jgi:anti-sigma B factor antagonist
VILDLWGTITEGEDGELLRDAVISLIDQGHTKLALNLAGVTAFDDSGLYALVTAYTTVRRKGGKLRLLNLTRLDLRDKHLSE